MIVNAALEASAAALLVKLSLASWTAMLIMFTCDPRKSATPYTLLLAGVAGLTSFGSVLVVEDVASWMDATRGLWLLSGILAVLLATFQLRNWLTTTPGDLYEESQRLNAAEPRGKSSRSSSKRNKSGSKSAGESKSPVSIGLAAFGSIASTAALLLTVSDLEQVPSGMRMLAAEVHMCAIACLLGTAVVCGIQLTFLSSPDALAPAKGCRVRWSGIAGVALVLAIIELLLCLVVFMSQPEDAGVDFQSGMVARLFAFTLLVIGYTTWMIPHRVSVFQRTGKSSGWVSLAIASWLCVLTLFVVSGLPASWPWKSI